MLEEAIELFIDIAEQNEDVEAIIDELRNLNSAGEITDEEYDYILQHWDELLQQHGLL